jgi:hypothetical protein
VGVWICIGLDFDSLIGECLDVAALLLHALVVRDYSDVDTSPMSVQNGVSK